MKRKITQHLGKNASVRNVLLALAGRLEKSGAITLDASEVHRVHVMTRAVTTTTNEGL